MSSENLNITHLIDLALSGTQVNFNVLHEICLIFAKELDLLSKTIQIPIMPSQSNLDQRVVSTQDFQTKYQQTKQISRLDQSYGYNQAYYGNDEIITRLNKLEKSNKDLNSSVNELKKRLRFYERFGNDVEFKKPTTESEIQLVKPFILDKIEKCDQQGEIALPTIKLSNMSSNVKKLVEELQIEEEVMAEIENLCHTTQSSTNEEFEDLTFCNESSKKSKKSENLDQVEEQCEEEKFKKLDRKTYVLNCKIIDVHNDVFNMEKLLFNLNDRFENYVVEQSQLETVKNQEKFCETLNKIYQNYKDLDIKTAEIDCALCKLTHNFENTEDTINDINNTKKEIYLLRNEKVDKYQYRQEIGQKLDVDIFEEKLNFFCSFKTRTEDSLQTISQKQRKFESDLIQIQEILQAKLNKDEYIGRKQFVDDKFNEIDAYIKFLLQFYNTNAAVSNNTTSGSKSDQKYIGNLNCISCNKKVILKIEPESKVAKFEYAKPKRKNIENKNLNLYKPFLEQKLDEIRNEMYKCGNDNGRNLNHFESAIQMNNTIKKGKITNDKVKRMVNRYCGGSNTILSNGDKLKQKLLPNALKIIDATMCPPCNEICRCKPNKK